MAKCELKAHLQFEAETGDDILDILKQALRHANDADSEAPKARGYFNLDSDEGFASRTCSSRIDPYWLFDYGSKTMKPRPSESTAESRATTILMSLLGYTAVIGYAKAEAVMEESGETGVFDQMLKMLVDELEIVAEHGFETMCAAPDCREMDEAGKAIALPGMITWQQLKEARDETAE